MLVRDITFVLLPYYYVCIKKLVYFGVQAYHFSCQVLFRRIILVISLIYIKIVANTSNDSYKETSRLNSEGEQW